VRALEQDRLFVRVLVARSGGLWERCREAMAPLEPHLPWRPDMLRARADCYQQAGDDRAKRAAADLQEFLEADRSAPHPTTSAPPR
jgi:spermidine synthase